MSKEAKVGLVVIVAIVAGVWGFNYLKGANLFNSGNLKLHATYQNVGGLNSSSPVSFNGLKVGRVTNIRIASKDELKEQVYLDLAGDPSRINMSALNSEFIETLLSKPEHKGKSKNNLLQDILLHKIKIEDNILNSKFIDSLISTPKYSGRLRVNFDIINKSIFIPSDSRAKIISSDLLGSKAVELVLGEDTVFLQSGQLIDSDIQQDLTEAVRAELEPLKVKTEQLMEDVDRFLLVLKGILEDDASKSIPEAFKSLSRSLKTLETSSARVDGMIAENREDLKIGITQFKELATTLTANSVNIDSILMNFRTVSADLADTDISTTISNANKIIKDMGLIAAKINNGEGSLGQLVNSDSLVIELQQSNQELQYLLNDLYTHPKKYVGFSIIGRKDRNGFSNKEEDEIKELIQEETDQ